MKILFYRYNSICEPDIIDQFSKIGIEIDCIENEMTDKKITASKRVDLVSERLAKNTYLFVFSINFFPAISDLCNIYNIPYIGWTVDSPLPEIYSKSVTNPCNRLFLFDRKQYEDLTPFCSKTIFHLPLGTNVTRWDNIISSITKDDRQKYSSDISFVGSLYENKDVYSLINNPSDYLQGFVAGLMTVQQELQGANIIEKSLTDEIITEIKNKCPEKYLNNEYYIKNMDRYVTAHSILEMHCAYLERVNILNTLSHFFRVDLYTRSDISKLPQCENLFCHDSVSTLTEMPKVFNLSKINLNITIRSIEKGAPLRVWDILGCGGFLLTNYQEELDDYLIAGEDYDYYTDLDDLVEKCDFYLQHNEIRNRIALSGYNKVKENHTYAHRVLEMMKFIS